MRRSKFEMHLDIIRTLAQKGPLKLTHIMYKANVNCSVLREQLDFLIQENIVNEKTLKSTARYLEIAKEAGMSPVTLATAWSMDFDFVASTIIGARTADQLDESLAALEVSLSDELKVKCDEVHQEFLYPMG